MNNKRLTRKQREQLFCRYYLTLLDAESAASQAGLSNPSKTGPLLLTEKRIQAYLRELEEQNKSILMSQAIQGYRRLAFSSAEDAARLLENSLDPTQADHLDLFSVSEIKASSSGIQIKFFDRQKALDKLCELAEISQKPSDEESLTDALSDAISKGAEALSRNRISANDS